MSTKPGELHTTMPYAITTAPSNGHERRGIVTVKTYRQLVDEYATHAETKSAGVDGTRCHRRTFGLLARRDLMARTITHIGKEANQLDEAQTGLLDDADGVRTVYDDTELLRFQSEVLPELRVLGVREVVRRTGNSLGAVHAVIHGRAVPRAGSREKYRRALGPTRVRLLRHDA